MEAHEQRMREALDLARTSVHEGGGPFAALVVRDGEVVGRGTNRVTASNDPTAHAEVQAIRDACSALGTYELAGCVVYTTCEPCPMCLGALWWSRVDAIYFAGTRQDAAAAGFDDARLYTEVAAPLSERTLPMTHVLAAEGDAPFRVWAKHAERTPY